MQTIFCPGMSYGALLKSGGVPMSRKALLLSIFIIIVSMMALLSSGMHCTGTWNNSGFPLADVEHTLGVEGEHLPDGVYMFGLPRNDLRVTMGDFVLCPAMALDSWAGFYGMGGEWMMMGDLVLRTEELPAAEDALRREGLSITAIHNTLAGENPQVFDLHIGGSGDPMEIAQALRNVLKAANFTINAPVSHACAMSEGRQDTAAIDRIMGTNGTYDDGVLIYRMPRAEKISENGMEIPPSLDVATVIKLQPLPDGRAAMTGEFVLAATEVEPVISKLGSNGITVTATHSHMLEEQPRLFYLHVWAIGDPLQLAGGLREALDQTNVL